VHICTRYACMYVYYDIVYILYGLTETVCTLSNHSMLTSMHYYYISYLILYTNPLLLLRSYGVYTTRHLRVPRCSSYLELHNCVKVIVHIALQLILRYAPPDEEVSIIK